MGQTTSSQAPLNAKAEVIPSASLNSTVPSRVVGSEKQSVWQELNEQQAGGLIHPGAASTNSALMPSSMPRFPALDPEAEADEVDWTFHHQQSFSQKLWSKCKQDPFVPIGNGTDITQHDSIVQ